jgi:transposase
MVRAAKRKPSSKSVGMIDVLRELLARGDNDGVIDLVTKLMATHEDQLRSMFEKARKQSTKNEGTSSAQLTFLIDEMKKMAATSTDEATTNLAAVAPVPAPTKQRYGPKPPPPRRRPLPNLPHVDNEIKVPTAERPCPICGRDRKCIGHETTHVIDIEPARAIIRDDRREKIACDNCDGAMTTAPLGDKVVEGGAYGSRLVADMLVAKYADGLPIHRQHERYQRIGLDLPTSTMGDQIGWATDCLMPVAHKLFECVLTSQTMHLDATSLAVLDRDDPNGIRVGALWGYVGVNVDDSGDSSDQCAAYLYNSTGEKIATKPGEIGPEQALELRRHRELPHVVADADGRFDAAFSKPGLVEVGCNMHGRRYFTKALDAGDQRAAMPLAAFKKLYDIEEKLRGKPPAEKLAVRRTESRIVYDALIVWCEAHKKNEPPTSKLAVATRYLTKHQIALTEFLDDGTLPIDNGIVERLHRKPAQGRRAYLFAGSDVGGHRAAIAYSVLGTCRLLDINPTEYLADVLPKLARGVLVPARDLPPLMPAAWARSRRPIALS